MGNYYFLSTFLPDLIWGQKPALALSDFFALCQENMGSAGEKQMQLLRLELDLVNLRRYWQGDELDPAGNYAASDIEKALGNRNFYPPFVSAFVERYSSTQERLKHFGELWTDYFSYTQSKGGRFVRFYSRFECEARLIFARLRAKTLGRDILQEPAFSVEFLKENETVLEHDEILGKLFESYRSDPIGLHRAYQKYRFETIDSWQSNGPFSVDCIIKYMVQLITLHRMR